MVESEEYVRQELEKGIGDLEKSISKFAPDSCEKTIWEVLKDSNVRGAIIKEFIGHEMVLQTVNCKGEHDQIKVNFTFQCRPPRICIIAHIITVTYDLTSHKVVGTDHWP